MRSIAGALVLVAAAALPAAPAAAVAAKSADTPLRILHADRFPMDRAQDTVVLEGHVRVARGNSILSGEYLKWKRKDGVVEVRGDVAITDEKFRLDADELLYDLNDESITAWGSPRIRELANEPGGTYTELKAVQLRLFPKEGRIEALENVEVIQGKGEPPPGGSPLSPSPSASPSPSPPPGPTVEMRVTCRVGEMLSRGKRNVFKGDVAVETREIGARAGRMLYEQESRRVYLLDGARVWNYDSQGKRLDELRGDKVVHFLDDGRTVAIGGVRAAVHPEATLGAAPSAADGPGRKKPTMPTGSSSEPATLTRAKGAGP